VIIVAAADANYDWDPADEHIVAIRNFISAFLLVPIEDFLGPPPHAPAALAGRGVENRSLFLVEQLNNLSWSPNPSNSEVNVSSYRIYSYLSADEVILLDEVEAHTFEYWHREPEYSRQGEEYLYAVTSVTDEGVESLPGFIWIVEPEER
jgi:hypothetical protein